MLKYFIVLFFFLLFASKTYMFYLNKYYVQLVNEIKEVRKDFDLLNVEWMYLNQPKRVQALSKNLNKKFDKYKK